MFPIPTSFIVYGAIGLAGAGAAWYVQDLRSDKAELTQEVLDLKESIRLTNKAITKREEQVAANLKEGDEKLAAEVAKNALNEGAIEALLDKAKNSANLTCEASVLNAQAIFRSRK